MIKFTNEEKEVLKMLEIKPKLLYSKKELCNIYDVLEDNIMDVGIDVYEDPDNLNETGVIMEGMLNKLGEAGYSEM